MSLKGVFILLFVAVTFTILARPSSSSVDSFFYVGCTQLRYSPGSPYESNLNSLLTSLVNSAMSSAPFNKFTIPGGSDPSNTVHGLYQCRGDLGTGPECGRCVARSVSQVAALCPQACGVALQLEGCYVKYDNATFLGVEDKTVAYRKCGGSSRFESDELTRRDAVLGYISGGAGQTFRVGGSGTVQGMAQCTGDLSASECQDCVGDAIGRLRSECGVAESGDMFLAKCYARYWEGGEHSHAQSGKRHLATWGGFFIASFGFGFPFLVLGNY